MVLNGFTVAAVAFANGPIVLHQFDGLEAFDPLETGFGFHPIGN